MPKIRSGMVAFALAVGAICAPGGPANAEICDHLAARIAQLQADEQRLVPAMERGLVGDYVFEEGSHSRATAPGAQQQNLLRSYDSRIASVRRERAKYEREFARKNCAERLAQRDAAQRAATNAALGAIGFGIMSGAMGGGYRGGYRSGSGGSGYSGRSSYPSGGGSGSYRRY